MIRLRRPVLALMFLLSLCACKREKRVRVQTEEEPPSLAMMLSMADPRGKTQLVSGFYGLENNAWRWTSGKFTVMLRPPRGAETKGAFIKLKFNLPEVIIGPLKKISITAAVNGTTLSPETYTEPGEYTYTREVAAKDFVGDSIKVDFTLDKTLPPQGGDKRELGVIATMVGFEGK